MFSTGLDVFADWPCIRLGNESLNLWVTTSIGPRILGLALNGGENLFAELPDLALECPSKGAYHFHGGDRLWYAPEDPLRTYLPDKKHLAIRQLHMGSRLPSPPSLKPEGRNE